MNNYFDNIYPILKEYSKVFGESRENHHVFDRHCFYFQVSEEINFLLYVGKVETTATKFSFHNRHYTKRYGVEEILESDLIDFTMKEKILFNLDLFTVGFVEKNGTS